MKFSDEQIQQLFRFTEKKRVPWYDLQVELVDHLASRIEEETDANLTLSFEQALDRVYKEFGIFGFAKIVQEKSDQLYKQSRRMWWSAVGAFFTWPKFALLALSAYLFWQLGNLFDTNWLMFGLALAYLIASIVLMRFMYRAGKSKRKLLLLQAGTGYSSSMVFMYQFLLFYGKDHYHPLTFCIMATLALVIKLASFQVFFKVQKQARALYPEV